MSPPHKVSPLTGALLSIGLFAVVLVAGLLGSHGASEGPVESMRAFSDLDCASTAPRVDVTLGNATVAPGAPVNATVTLANPTNASWPVRVDAVTVGVHALSAAGDLKPVTSVTRDVHRPLSVATDARALAPDALVTLRALGAPAVAWNGTAADGAPLAPGVYVLTVHVNAVPGTPCGEQVMGYQVFEVRAHGASGAEVQAAPPETT